MSSFLSRILYRSFSSSPKPSPKRAKLPTSTFNKIYSEKDDTKLVETFKKLSETGRFRMFGSCLYRHTVYHLSKVQKLEMIEEILEDQKKYTGDVKKEGFAVRIISLYGKAGMADHAYKTFKQLPQFKCECTYKSINAVLTAHLDSGKYKEVEPMFRELVKKFELSPDKYPYNVVIRAFIKMEDLDGVFKIFDEMRGNGVEPDVHCYGQILRELYGKSELCSKGDEIWEMMEGKGIVPDIGCYNSKMNGLVISGKMSEAEKLVKELENKKKELKPDAFMYNHLLRGYCNEGNLEKAMRMFDKNSKAKVNRGSYDIIVPCLCEKGELDTALEMCNKGLATNNFGLERAIQAVKDALVKASRDEEAKEFADRAKEKKDAYYSNFSRSRKSSTTSSDSD